MHHKHAIRTLFVSLWLPLCVGLAPVSWAEPYADAMAVQADGEAVKWVQLATRLAEENSGEADEGCEWTAGI